MWMTDARDEGSVWGPGDARRAFMNRRKAHVAVIEEALVRTTSPVSSPIDV